MRTGDTGSVAYRDRHPADNTERSAVTTTFRCPACDNRFRIDERMRGKKVRCPNAKCRSSVLIPNSAASTSKGTDVSGKPTGAVSDAGGFSQSNLASVTLQNGEAFHRSKFSLVLRVLAMVVVCLAAAGTAVVLKTKNKTDPFTDLVNKTVPQNESLAEFEREAQQAKVQTENEQRELEEHERVEKLAAEEAARKESNEERMAADKLSSDQQAERLRQEAGVAQTKAAPEASHNEDGPFAVIGNDLQLHDRYGQWLFELPSPEEQSISKPLPLLTKGSAVELSLCEAAETLFARSLTQLKILRSPDVENTWRVEATQASTTIVLGEYTLQAVAPAEPDVAVPDYQLVFRWKRDAAREKLAAELLRWWPLQITVGDKSAVLLQRTSYVSEIPLKWDSFVNAQKIVLPRSTEMQAIEQASNSLLSFCIEIQQTGEPPQTLRMNLGIRELEGSVREPNSTPVISSTNFPLMLPLRFQQTVPQVYESPHGFGTLNVHVSRTPAEGLVLQPKVELALRLPGNRHLETFPNQETLDSFKAIAREPERILDRPSTIEIRNIARQTTQQTRDNHEFWHRQPLRAIAKRTGFEPVILDRAQNSINAMKQIVRSAERDVNAARTAVSEQQRHIATLAERRRGDGGMGLARMMEVAENGLTRLQQQVRQAETKLNAARQLEPAIDRYCEDLTTMMAEFTQQHESLMQDYDVIGRQVEKLLDASKTDAFRIRGEMSASIPIPQAENGPTIQIYFVEAMSLPAK